MKNGGVEAVNPDSVIMAKLNMDDFSDGERQSLWSMASKISNLPLYEGHVEHGYGLDFVPTSQQCPRCRAATQQHYANFIYATQMAPRVMFAPAGYFCTKCPTVIVDEDMIRSAVDKRFNFQGVLGLDYDGRERPDFFKTWNGKKTVYMLDEHQFAIGFGTIEPTHSQCSIKKEHKARQREHMAKQSRKQNRRKK